MDLKRNKRTTESSTFSTTYNPHSTMIAGIEKEPLIPRDQSQISVERSTGPSLVIRTHPSTPSLSNLTGPPLIASPEWEEALAILNRAMPQVAY